MKVRKSIAAASVVAVVPLALSLSAGPASAMPKSCLTMYTGYQQATLAATAADATMTSFEDNVQWYADSNGFYREKGWYYDFTGGMQYYDLDPATWADWDSIYIWEAQFQEDQAADAYDAYVSECGY
jgi:hypothetical protein